MTRTFIEIEGIRGIIRAVLHTPDLSKLKSDTLVVPIVGLNGNRSDLNRILVNLADDLSVNNISTLRFDFFGMGMSDGFFSQSTISSKTDDLLSVDNYIRKQMPYIKKICYLTLSDGIQVLMNAINLNKEIRRNHIINWSPVLIDIEDSYSPVRGELSKPRRECQSKKLCIQFLGLWISLNYLKEKRDLDFAKMFKNFELRNDQLYSYIYAKNDVKVKESRDLLFEKGVIQYVEVKNGGHSFCTYESHEQVIENTVSCLCNNLWS